MSSATELIASIAKRDLPRTEATLQADIRQLLLTAPLGLAEDDLRDIVLESPVGDRRRIDVEIGSTVIEAKKDLRKGKVRSEAVDQLSGYLEHRQANTGCRYVGVLTDGAEWRCYHLAAGEPFEVSSIVVDGASPDIDEFLVWLEGVMATAQGIPPSPVEIGRRLGAASSSHALDHATLSSLYQRHRDQPSVRMKRDLWARLLTTALGTNFRDDDELFVEHTLLVNSAEIIAHAVLGLDPKTIGPTSLMSGAKFDEAGIYGVVESDFFDWVVEVPEGDKYVRALARRLGRFDWGEVEHDVLKVLYESVISAETRKILGEYYTPDWLAEKIVMDAVSAPLTERVLDPACGSGTFVFHAIRKYLAAAEEAEQPLRTTLAGLTQHVIGMDLHPVAVTLARVTYILAIGRKRLTDASRGVIQVPVYLGDSLQWQRNAKDLWSAENLIVKTDDRLELFPSELRFPDALLKNARVFDELVKELAAKASARVSGSAPPALTGVFQRLAIPPDMQPTIVGTFKTMCRLNDEGRDHIWGYYIRNLARPTWLARHENQVDVLVGNPPWLAYRHMSAEMQELFRDMSESRDLWHGATVATHQDLSGLFIARTIELYLRPGGRFAMVLPNAVIDRAQFAGFRTGYYPSRDAARAVNVRFWTPWDLRRIRPHFFPRGAAIAFGVREDTPTPMPTAIEVWSGRLPRTDAAWEEVKEALAREPGQARPSSHEALSPYRARFTQGAIFAPRVLFLVEERDAGPLGVPGGKVAVRSHRGANEKKPYKQLDNQEGVVETEFLRPVYLGEVVLPYRTLHPLKVIVPRDADGLFDETSRLELYPGLADWWRAAEEVWIAHRQKSSKLSLLQQLDYRGKLTKQFPIQPQRIVYSKSGMHLVAARISDHRAVINNSLYWATVVTEEEALYLCAILNAAKVTELVRPLMSYGKDERHFDKYIWQLPIPLYDDTIDLHRALASLGKRAEEEIAQIEFPASHFTALRRLVRQHLAASPVGKEIGLLVEELLA